MSAFNPTNVTPCTASQSALAAVASAAVVSAGEVSVIFSTPTASALVTTPDPTAIMAVLKARAPEPQAASTVIASIPRIPTQSEIRAPR